MNQNQTSEWGWLMELASMHQNTGKEEVKKKIRTENKPT